MLIVLLFSYLGIINDFKEEEQYLQSLPDDSYMDVDDGLRQFYDKQPIELFKMFKKYARKFDKKHLVCAFKTNGGFEKDSSYMLNTFTGDRFGYYSDSFVNLGHRNIYVTGIACEENFNDYVVAKNLLKNVINISKDLGIKISKTHFLPYEKSEFNIGEAPQLNLSNEDLCNSFHHFNQLTLSYSCLQPKTTKLLAQK